MEKYHLSLSLDVPLILIAQEVIFLRAKHIMGDFEGFFDPKIALRCAQDNLGNKKSLGPLEKP